MTARPAPGAPASKRASAASASPAAHPERETVQRVYEDRHHLNEQPVEDETDTTPVIGEAEHMAVFERDGVELLRVRVGGCWFVCRDVEAGMRAYTGERGAHRCWTGAAQRPHGVRARSQPRPRTQQRRRRPPHQPSAQGRHRLQHLRASASIVIDWPLAAERNGWFGTPPATAARSSSATRDAVRRLHRMRQERNLHLTGRRYPGHGRRRPVYRDASASQRPGEPAPEDDRRSILNDIPF